MEKEADVPQLHKIAYGKLNHHNHNFWANVDGCDDVVATEEWSSCGVGGLGSMVVGGDGGWTRGWRWVASFLGGHFGCEARFKGLIYAH